MATRSAPPTKVNLAQAFARFREQWCPHVAGEVNDCQVKLTKLQGEFVWHHHDEEDELFLVVRGRLTMQLRTGDVVIDPGEFLVVPHGVEHCPKADEECWVLLLEPKTTLNTGNVVNERTRRELERL
jgi:mannose-6-phosphate isomerase-like protein (cupin superfamily)